MTDALSWGLAAGAAVLAAALFVWTRYLRPLGRYRWSADPVVLLARGCPASVDDVEWAVGWWKRRGARFAWSISRQADERRPGPGSIVLLPAPRDARSRELVRYEFTEGGELSRVFVALPERNYGLESGRKLLVHLVGHALGLAHVHRGGHVMASSPSHRAWGDDGLEDALCAVFGRGRSALAIDSAPHAQVPETASRYEDDEVSEPRIPRADPLRPPAVH